MAAISTALAILSLLSLAPAAVAADEDGDAGDLPATARDLTGSPVERIDGSIADASDIDMYRICLDGDGSFSASAVGGTAVDTQLFLFDSAGRGVYANDDEREGVVQSLLPAGHPLTPRIGGEYLLAVGAYNLDPLSAGGPIFPTGTAVVGPTGSGGGDPVTGWGGRAGGSGAYTLHLTGARCAPPEQDTTPPTVELRSPLDGAVYVLDEAVRADYACADETELVSCAGPVPDGAPVDTSSVGPQEFAVTGADAAGNSATATASFTVVYDFEGLLWPVRNRPRVNTWRAGVPVPIRFELGGNKGLDVIEDGWPQVAEVSCDFAEEAERGDPARHRKLAFRRRKGHYLLRWKTERDWAGSCRQFLLKLKDGTVRRADFSFFGRR